MTCAFDSTSEYVFAAKAPLADKRAAAKAELEKMGQVMVMEKGLFNYTQAAEVLGVSTKRVWELVRLRKLTKFVFLGRPYVSGREVLERYNAELAAGDRVRLTPGKRFVRNVKVVMQTDLGQWKSAYHETKKKEEVKKRNARKKRSELVKKILDPRAVPDEKGRIMT